MKRHSAESLMVALFVIPLAGFVVAWPGEDSGTPSSPAGPDLSNVLTDDLQRRLSDEDARTRADTVRELRRARSPLIFNRLKFIFETDDRAPVRAAAAWAIGPLGRRQRAVPLLGLGLSDSGGHRVGRVDVSVEVDGDGTVAVAAVGVDEPSRSGDTLRSPCRDAVACGAFETPEVEDSEAS